jgi:urease accessory protein
MSIERARKAGRLKGGKAGMEGWKAGRREGKVGRWKVEGLEILALLHLCDSLFPVGAFAYSDGLESATASGRVASAGDLRAWMETCRDESIARTDGPAVWQGWAAFRDADWETLVTLDGELMALRPAAAARRSSRAIGLRLLTTWQGLHPDARLAHALALARDAGRERGFGPALPMAFAGACACSGIGRRRAVEAFAYTRLAATVSAAMRLMAIGQTEAHTILARTLERVPEVVDAIERRDAQIESFAPAADIAAMTQKYLHSRLFLS